MKREEAIERFNGIINAMSISIAQSKFYPSKAELDELCDMAIEALSADTVSRFHHDMEVKELKHQIKDQEPLRVDVVRCKDCKHRSNSGWCDVYIQPRMDTDFCNHGERQCNYFGERREK